MTKIIQALITSGFAVIKTSDGGGYGKGGYPLVPGGIPLCAKRHTPQSREAYHLRPRGILICQKTHTLWRSIRKNGGN